MVSRPLVWIVGSLAVLCAATTQLAATGPQQASTESSASVAPPRNFVNRHCVACHNDRARTGGLALDTLDVENVSENPEVWEKAVQKLRARTMPPIGRPRPDEGSYDAVVSHLETSLDRLAATSPNPGRTDTFRRLNRTEYRNVIRDLLALEVDVESLLPSDESNYGFDNVGVGGLSPMLMERYLSAAQKISRLAIGSPFRSPGGATIMLPPDLTQERHLEGLPFGTRGGTMVSHHFPRDAEYEVQIQLRRDVNDHIDGLTEPHELELTLDAERIELFTVEPTPRGEGPGSERAAEEGTFKVRLPVNAGPREVGVTFLRKTSARYETQRQPYQSHFGARLSPTQPSLESVSILGPFDSVGAGDTPSRRRIYVCRPTEPSEDAACAKTIISTLARRAYRRPVTDADLEVPLAFYEEAQAKVGFEAGIEAALRALLVSPQFLFRIELDPPNVAPNAVYRVGDLALASRLSFFLWSSMPDDELLDLAARGTLREAAVFKAQVERMLADPRSEALTTNFAGQWLYLRNLAAVSPDPRSFPDFDDNLRQAFRRETELFFESIVNENRSVLDLLTANYTFLNERLAKHYGIPHVYGSHFRRVTLDDNSVRAGLLGQGSILTVTSYATRTSPVLRGKWVLENILGAPPPPPPPNVPPLQEGSPGGKVLSMRERMVQHRANPVCASCHQLMDPVGLSTENFDAVGRWRTRDEGGTPIDASGGLPDGSTFEGVAGLRQALLNRPELFVRTMTEKLLTYALGRGLEYFDAPTARTIMREARSSDYRFSSLIQGIVNSAPFQMRRSQ